MCTRPAPTGWRSIRLPGSIFVRDEQAVKSTAHGHGPNCTGIRKMVDYPLTPGPYILQISANGQPQMTVLLARLP
jgi:hypothetical protein